MRCRKEFIHLLIAAITLMSGSVFMVNYFVDTEKRAENGDLDAIYTVAIQLNNDGDVTKAYKLFEKAANGGHALAQLKMGYKFAFETSVLTKDHNDIIALQWILKSAEQGVMGAQISAASFYQYGRGTKSDMSKRIYWLEKAAELFCKPAMTQLIKIYSKGDYTDKVKHKYYLRALTESSN